MARIYIDLTPANSGLTKEELLVQKLDTLSMDLSSVQRDLRYKIAAQERISAHLTDVISQVSREKAAVSALGEGLAEIIAQYNRVERLDLERLVADEVARNEIAADTGGLPIFEGSGNGEYGGDQGDLANKHNGWKLPWGWVWFEDKGVYNFVKEHEGYENFTESQIHDLLDKMNQEGCGYIGIVNAIFAEYEGSEEEFEKRFGFPMRDKNGDYNYNYMFIDLYCATDNKYYLNESQGVTALTIEMLCSYQDDPEAFYIKYGISLGYEDGNGDFIFSDDARLAVINEINSTYESNDVVTFADTRDGLTVSAQENHIAAYLHQKGVDPQNISYDHSSVMDADTIKDNLDDGKIMQALSLSGTEMYQDGGKTITLPGGHYVTITGVADDGRYIVSSWGEKYYIDPNQADVATYQTIDLEL